MDNAPSLAHIFLMRSVQIPPLTGIRGWLALWVFSIHASIAAPGLPLLKNAFVANGFLGVDGFFILSGLVLYYVHGEEMRDISPARIGDFLLLRLARIYPLHLFMFGLYLLYVVGLIAAGGTRNPGEYSTYAALAHLTLTQAWFISGRFIQTWNSPAWTISAEWAAYLIFPLLAWLASRTKPTLLFLSSLSIFVIFEFAYGLSNANNVFRVVPEFLLGISLIKMAPLSRHVAQAFSLLAILAIVCGTLWNDTLTPVLGLAALVYCLHSGGTVAAWLLSTRVSLWLGKISYAFYMCHMFVLKLSNFLLKGKASGGLMIFVALCLSLAMAAFSYHFIETPARHWIRSFRPATAERKTLAEA